jgi:diketogulonate reductase-like aldo/keto reductase
MVRQNVIEQRGGVTVGAASFPTIAIATRNIIVRGIDMEFRRLGSTKHQVPVIGQGTWYIGSGDRATAIAALQLGLDLGMTHIDTAQMYGDAEEIVGEAIAGRRNEVFLVSKVLPQNGSLSGAIAACERSLARLDTDWLDCYLLHWRGAYPLEETIEAFERLQSQGKILSWGVSNFDVPDLEEACEIAGAGRLVCNQVLYYLQERAIEYAVIPWCEEHRVAVVGYAPFGHGDFPGPRTKGGRVLQEIAAAHEALHARLRCGFWCGDPRFLRSRRPPVPNMRRKTPELAISASPRAAPDEMNCAE